MKTITKGIIQIGKNNYKLCNNKNFDLVIDSKEEIPFNKGEIFAIIGKDNKIFIYETINKHELSCITVADEWKYLKE